MHLRATTVRPAALASATASSVWVPGWNQSVFEGDERGHLATLTAEGRALLRRATSVHVHGLREHLLTHMSRTELEGLVIALEAVLDGEGTPMPPLTAS